MAAGGSDMTRRALAIEVDLEGALFRPGARGIVVDAVEHAKRRVVEMGHQRLAERFRMRPAGVYLSVAQGGKSTGHYRRNINSVIPGPGKAGVLHDSGVVYGPWLEGISSRNAVTRFKGYAVWRNTAQWLQKRAQRVATMSVRHVIRDLGGA